MNEDTKINILTYFEAFRENSVTVKLTYNISSILKKLIATWPMQTSRKEKCAYNCIIFSSGQIVHIEF